MSYSTSLQERIDLLTSGKVYDILLSIEETCAKSNQAFKIMSDWERNFVSDNVTRLRHSIASPKVTNWIVKIAAKLKLPVLKKYGIEDAIEPVDAPTKDQDKNLNDFDIICKELNSIPSEVALKALGKTWGLPIISEHVAGRRLSEKQKRYITDCLCVLHPLLPSEKYSNISKFIEKYSDKDPANYRASPEWLFLAHTAATAMCQAGEIRETKLQRAIAKFFAEKTPASWLELLKLPNSNTEYLFIQMGKSNVRGVEDISTALQNFHLVYRNDKVIDKLLEPFESVGSVVEYPEDIRNLTHECLRFLANRCDFAHDEDGVGFNKSDTVHGHELSDKTTLSNADMPFAIGCVRFYKGQLDPKTVKLILKAHIDAVTKSGTVLEDEVDVFPSFQQFLLSIIEKAG